MAAATTTVYSLTIEISRWKSYLLEEHDIRFNIDATVVMSCVVGQGATRARLRTIFRAYSSVAVHFTNNFGIN